MYDEQHFTHDSAIASFTTEADGITVDSEDEVTIDWSKVRTVTVDNPPHAEAFDTKQFYRLPATVAKPIRQPYHYGEDNLVWLKKPREELKKAAWSLDNAPVTLDHPDTTMVKDVEDVHGFWDDTQYVDAVDDLDSYAHIPVDDEAAKSHIEENGDVSVGFYNRVARTDEYDGVVGGDDDDDEETIDGYQTNMLFNHCAFVDTGRCSSEQGCGLDTGPAHGRGHVAVDGEDGPAFKYGTSITNISETEETTDSMRETTDQPEGIHVMDGDWYGIAPSETSDDEPKYDLNTCNDVRDAWNLRGSGDYDIEQSTLEARIKRAADSHDCPAEYRPWESVEEETDCTDCGDCTEKTTNTFTMSELEIDLDDLAAEAAIDKLAEQHEGIKELTDELSELRDVKESVDEVLEAFDAESLDEVADTYEELSDKADAYDEIEQERMEQDAEHLVELTDRFEGADEVLEQYDTREDIQDRIDLLEDAVETSETTTDSGPSDPETEIRGNRYEPDAWT